MHVARRFNVVGIDRSDYMARDVARATSFYEDVLGLTRSSGDQQGCEFDLDDGSTFGLWLGDPPGVGFATSNSVMFAVDDLDAAIADITARDIEITMQVETSVCRFIAFLDCEGNTVTLHRRKSSA